MRWLTLGDRSFVVLMAMAIIITVVFTTPIWLPLLTQWYHNFRKSVEQAIEDAESIDRE